MADHHCGRPEKARASLRQAVVWIEQADRLERERPPTRLQGWLHWMERAEVSRLRAEAEALLDGKK